MQKQRAGTVRDHRRYGVYRLDEASHRGPDKSRLGQLHYWDQRAVDRVGLSKINAFADSVSVQRPVILGPDYWEALCSRHQSRIERYLDYRVFVTECQVIEAMKKARFYDSVVTQTLGSMTASPLVVRLTNNRTPVALEIPFSTDLTVGRLLKIVQSLLGISLQPTEFPDLETSCQPALSITVDRVSQSFDLKLCDLSDEQREKLQLWIKLIWKDHRGTTGADDDLMHFRVQREGPAARLPLSARREETLNRLASTIQDSIGDLPSV